MSKPIKKRTSRGAAALRATAARARSEPYDLCLFIAGTTPHSTIAVAAVTALCEARLRGRYQLSIVDVYQDPARARQEQVIVVPLLLKRHPLPIRRLVGDLSDRARLLAGLNLPPDGSEGHEEAR